MSNKQLPYHTIEWVSEIKHLGNNLNISRNDELDCQIKKRIL